MAELRSAIHYLAQTSPLHCEPVPAYLLCRQPHKWLSAGQVVYVAGAIRNHVAAAELSEWADALQRGLFSAATSRTLRSQ